VGLQVDEGSMNRLWEGYTTLFEVPKNEGADFVFDEETPFIATGPFKFVAYKDREPNEKETEQLTTRFQYFSFDRSIPHAQQKKGFAPCPRCWAKWLLHGEIMYRKEKGKDPRSNTDVVDRAAERLFPAGEPQLGAYAKKISGLSSKRAATGPPATPPHRPPPPGQGGQAGASASAAPAQGTFADLKQLMEWRQAGLLTMDEFVTAKERFFGDEA
jgi:hypothetical protein